MKGLEQIVYGASTMSSLDRDIAEKVEKDLDTHLNDRVNLILVKPFQNQATNLALVEQLVRREKKNGIYVSIRRSHWFMREIMKKRKLSQRRILFLDAVHGISAMDLVDKDDWNVNLLQCPFSMGFEEDLKIAIEKAVSKGMTEFIIIDDLFALCCYMHSERLMRFIWTFFEELKQADIKKIFVIADSTTEPELSMELETVCDSVFNLK